MNFSRPLALGFAFAIIGSPAFAAPVKDAPKFDTIYNLVRSNLTGVSEAELNRAAGSIVEADGTPGLMEDFRMPWGESDKELPEGRGR